MFGATATLENIFVLLAMRDSFVPQTKNFENGGEECDLDYVPKRQDITINHAISNSFGFFGHNLSLVWNNPSQI